MMLKSKIARPLDQTEKELTNIDTMVTDDKGVTIHWTRLLDWTTGLAQNGVKCLFKPISV